MHLRDGGGAFSLLFFVQSTSGRHDRLAWNLINHPVTQIKNKSAMDELHTVFGGYYCCFNNWQPFYGYDIVALSPAKMHQRRRQLQLHALGLLTRDFCDDSGLFRETEHGNPAATQKT